MGLKNMMKDLPRKLASGFFAGGATLSVGFLSFVGMFAVSPVLGWCIAALVLAVAYEGQVYNEGVSNALRRMFDQNYLKKGLAKLEINKLIKSLEKVKEEACRNMLLLENGQEKLTEEQETLIAEQKKIKLEDIENEFLKKYFELNAFIKQVEENHHLSDEWLAKKERAEVELEDLKLFFIEQAQHPKKLGRTPSSLETSAAKLFVNPELMEPEKEEFTKIDREQLLVDINRKQWLIRFSWILAIGGGISSGLAALSAIVDGVAQLAALSTFFAAIPSVVLVSLALFAAVGYTFMLYQTMADVVQEYDGKWQQYFIAKPEESSFYYGLRVVGTVALITVGLLATVATAGTWWQLTEKGARLMNVGATVAGWVRNIFVPLMAVPTLIFNVTHSLSTAGKLGRADFKKNAAKLVKNVKDTRAKENIIQFSNPFRFLANVIDYTGRSIVLLLHAVSIGVISSIGFSTDRQNTLASRLAASFVGAANDGMVDADFLPVEENEHQHSHNSKLLDFMFLPLTIVVVAFKVPAVLWDVASSKEPNMKASWKKSFPGHAEWVAPATPKSVQDWCSSHGVIQRNGISNGNHVDTNKPVVTTKKKRSLSAPSVVPIVVAKNDQNIDHVPLQRTSTMMKP